MSRQRKIAISAIAFLWIGVLTVQALSPALGSNETRGGSSRPVSRSLQEVIEDPNFKTLDPKLREPLEQIFLKRERDKQMRRERADRLASEDEEKWRRYLGLNKQQFNTIWLRKDEVDLLRTETKRGTGIHHDHLRQTIDWGKYTEMPRAFPANEMTETMRLVDELVDLLRDKDTSDEQFRNTIDALQRARAKAREALPGVKQEMAALLETTRLEAIMLITGYIE